MNNLSAFDWLIIVVFAALLLSQLFKRLFPKPGRKTSGKEASKEKDDSGGKE